MGEQRTMNIERLTAIAEWLENGAPHVRFDMSKGFAIEVDPNDVTNVCGTSCCLAGAAVQFFDAPKEKTEELLTEVKDNEDLEDDNYFVEYEWENIFNEAMQLLGLDHETAYALFRPDNGYGGLDRFNDPAWAARTIRHLIATGEVDWAATKEDASGHV